MKELISIMIPAYNAEKYIERCLDSLVNQTYQEIEIVVVNDGSKDHTRQICEEYQKKDERIRLINQDNGGEGAARNRGLKEAKGRFLCFVDADDYVTSNFIENMYQMHEKYNAELTICGFVELKGTEIINQTSGEMQVMQQESAMENLLKESSFKGYVWNKMFDMEIIRKHNLQFDISLAIWTDVLFVFQYMLHIQKCVFDPKPQYYYIYIENSASHLANHLLGIEKSYSAIRAKDQMVNLVPVEYERVKTQLSVRYVQSSLAVIRNIGYLNGEGYEKYYNNCIELIKKYKKRAYVGLSKKDRVLAEVCAVCPKVLMLLYRMRK